MVHRSNTSPTEWRGFVCGATDGFSSTFIVQYKTLACAKAFCWGDQREYGLRPYCCRSFGIAQTLFGLSTLSLQHRTDGFSSHSSSSIKPPLARRFYTGATNGNRTRNTSTTNWCDNRFTMVAITDCSHMSDLLVLQSQTRSTTFEVVSRALLLPALRIFRPKGLTSHGRRI